MRSSALICHTQNNSIHFENSPLVSDICYKKPSYLHSLNSTHNEIQIRDITKNQKKKPIKNKFTRFLKDINENETQHVKAIHNNNKNSKIRKEIDKFTKNLICDNKNTKNRPIFTFTSNNTQNEKYYEKISPITKHFNFLVGIGNLGNKRSKSVNKFFELNPNDNVYERFNKQVIKTAKIELFEEARKNQNEIDDFSMQFDKNSQKSYLYKKYNNLNNTLYKSGPINIIKKKLSKSFSIN